jgi:hypothetical protein
VAARFRLLTQAAAAAIVALALLSAVKQLPDSVREADRRVRENAALSRLERDLAPARSFGLNPTLILRADELMPPHAVFHVASSPGQSTAQAAAASFSAYWLLPRRHTQDPRRADWILSFGVDPGTLGVEVELVEGDLGEPGWNLFRVRR